MGTSGCLLSVFALLFLAVFGVLGLNSAVSMDSTEVSEAVVIICDPFAVYDSAYTAQGEGITEPELSATTEFQPNDDLNVVVKLARKCDSKVTAVFINPSGESEEPLIVSASENTATVVLGLDWESVPNEELWLAGQWSVEIYIDDTLVETLNFTVKR